MNYVLLYFRRALLMTLPVLACWMLVPRLGTGLTLVLLAVVFGLAVGIAAWLFNTATVGEITWKNRLGAWLAPWGWALANGKLGQAMVASWIIWMLIGVAGVLLVRGSSFGPTLIDAPAAVVGSVASTNSVTPPVTTGSLLVTGLLMVAWFINGGALLYVLGVHVKNFSPGTPQSASLIKVMSLAGLVLAGSVGLYLAGYPLTALIVGGGPPLAIGLVFALFAIVMVTAGKNVRWN